MLLRSLVVAGLIGLASLTANGAKAQDSVTPPKPTFSGGISFFDANASFPRSGGKWNLNFSGNNAVQSSGYPIAGFQYDNRSTNRRYEVALGASGVGGIDVAIAQRASVGFDRSGDVSRHGRGAELRLGRGVNMPRRRTADWNNPTWYMFTAVDDEAITWRPGARNEFGDAGPSFALQDRVEIGDRQAGLTYERGPLQASLAYVERSVDARSFGRTISRDQRFAGFTLTMRH
ncbi:MAG: hypothetical protein ABUS48_02125 [Pseudomonadota bacterium]